MKAPLAPQVGSTYCPGLSLRTRTMREKRLPMLNPNTSWSCSRPTWSAVTLDREIQPVTQIEKLWDRLQSRFSERNFAFDDLRGILVSLGFDERIRGSHHLFTRSGIEEIVNLQPAGRLAKAYQVRKLVKRHELLEGRDDG